LIGSLTFCIDMLYVTGYVASLLSMTAMTKPPFLIREQHAKKVKAHTQTHTNNNTIASSSYDIYRITHIS
jgi:hypothetical protein